MNVRRLTMLAALLGLTSPACSSNRAGPGAAAADPQTTETTQTASAADPNASTQAERARAAEAQAADAEAVTAADPVRAPENAAPRAGDSPTQSKSGKDAPQADAQPTRTPDVVFVPTPQPVVDKMLELARIKKTDVVYDLGCGDGRIVVTAAKRFGVRAFGFDIDPKRVQEARQNVKESGVENLVTIEQKDIFTLDLSPANVVTLYLLPELNVKLIPQLEKLRPGSRIVSHDFDMQGVTPVTHLNVAAPGESRTHEVFLWNVPLKKEARASKL